LFFIHFRRVRNKTGPRNYSFYAAYLPAVLVMLVLSFIALREVSFHRPGSQFVGVTFFFLPNFTIPIILVGYIIGWVIERCIRRDNDIYKAEDALSRQAVCANLSKYRIIYIILLVLILALIGYNLLVPRSYDNIHEAAEYGDIEQIKHFLDKGVDINARNEDGETPLHFAAHYNNKSMIEFLMANGAAVDARDDIGETPLYNAAWSGETTSVNALIKHGADVNAKNIDGDTPLHEAVHMGRKSTVKILLANGADVNIKNNMDQPPLWEAVRWGRKDLTKLLIENGAEVNFTDKNSRTPLSIAIEEKYKGIEKLLRQHGAKE
jgi:hypothetical protein